MGPIFVKNIIKIGSPCAEIAKNKQTNKQTTKQTNKQQNKQQNKTKQNKKQKNKTKQKKKKKKNSTISLLLRKKNTEIWVGVSNLAWHTPSKQNWVPTYLFHFG